MSSFIERMVKRDIESINDHLPAERISLKELIGSKERVFKTRAGEMSVIRDSEIEMISELTPHDYHGHILLPIVLLRRIDLGSGIYSISGTKVELFLIHYLLEREIGGKILDWNRISEWTPQDRIARPQVQIIRKILPSSTCIGFTTLAKTRKTMKNSD